MSEFAEHLDFEMDFSVFMANEESLAAMLDMISRTKQKRSLLYIRNTTLSLGDIQKETDALGKNSLFYLALESETQVDFFYIITLNHRNRSIIEDLQFHSNSSKLIKESYNLQGMAITSTSLPWDPYIWFENCSENGYECETKGFYLEITNILAKRFNFTLISHR